MAMAHEHKFELKMELNSSPDKLWQGIREFTTLIPKAMPELYESIQVLEGDGVSVGTVFLSTIRPEMRTAKEKIEFVDEERKTMSYSILEGDILAGYKNYRSTVSVGSENRGTTVVKYSAEFEKVKDEQVPDVSVDGLKSTVLKIYHDLDAYLLNNP